MTPGRNDPCPCGSGEKYKKCCYLTGQDPAAKKLIESGGVQDLDDFDDDDDLDDFDDDDIDDDAYYDDEDLVNNDADYKKSKMFITVMNRLRGIVLDKKPHIRKYYKIRDMHSEIVSAMVQYHQDDKFKKQIDTEFYSESKHKKTTVDILECDFDLNTRTGMQGFYDMVIYKMAPNVSCITDDFIRDHRYRKPEKIEFLHSMLDSKLGLFEITGTDMKEGYAYLKDVFTGDEYTIIDIGLSGNLQNDDIYIYTRIITYQDITFGTGLGIFFRKTDGFIKKHIKQHKKDFNPNREFRRFTQLYNRYSKDPNRVRVTTNERE